MKKTLRMGDLLELDAPSVQHRLKVIIDSKNLVLVMLSASGAARTKNLRLPFDVLPAQAAQLAAVLNKYIAGHTPEEITLPVMMHAEEEMGSRAALLSIAMKEIFGGMEEQSGGTLNKRKASAIRARTATAMISAW